MSNEELSRVEAWSAKNQEKALALIEKHTDSKEEILYYATGWVYPPDIFSWLPIIGNIIDATKKRYLLAATTDNFVVIRIGKFRFEEITSELISMNSIRKSLVTKFPLFCNLRIELSNGRSYVFKQMLYAWAAGFKDAIDQAQGKASAVD